MLRCAVEAREGRSGTFVLLANGRGILTGDACGPIEKKVHFFTRARIQRGPTQQPRSGERMQPTTQVVGTEVKTSTKPRRGERKRSHPTALSLPERATGPCHPERR